MENDINSIGRTVKALHNNVRPSVSLRKRPALRSQINLTDRSWPFIGSCVVHAVLIVIISCPGFQNPLFISNQTAPVFWFSLIYPTDDSKEAQPPYHQPSVAFAAEHSVSVSAIKQHDLAASDAPVAPEYQKITPEIPADTAEVKSTFSVPLSAQTLAEVKDSHPTSIEPSQQQQPEKPQAIISLPIIRGELKLVVTTSVQPEITVTFTDFAPSRRDRPLSRNESRRIKIIVPLTTNTQDTSREIVIARVTPGIYTFTAEPTGEAVYAYTTLKLYEGTSGAVTREFGRRTIARKTVLVKILMPEGILWNDDAAFSGNMEDSEGVTKFNTETGLMWKEYTE